MSKVTYCGNCGNKGHIYKQCLLPITSLGVICVKYPVRFNDLLSKSHCMDHEEDNDMRLEVRKQLKLLMICRRNSIGYFEFLRGKWSFDNVKYLVSLFDLMTKEEKEKIVKNDFKMLWNELWNNQDRKQNTNEMRQAEFKFTNLKKGFHRERHNDIITLDHVLDESKVTWDEPEWGFPKGRRHLKENDLECALREFSEETNVKFEEIEMLSLDPVEEQFKGTNDVHYLHRYFLSQIVGDTVLSIDTSSESQMNEISQLRWVTMDEAIKLIRGYSEEKIALVKKVMSMLEHIVLSVDDK